MCLESAGNFSTELVDEHADGAAFGATKAGFRLHQIHTKGMVVRKSGVFRDEQYRFLPAVEGFW